MVLVTPGGSTSYIMREASTSALSPVEGGCDRSPALANKIVGQVSLMAFRWSAFGSGTSRVGAQSGRPCFGECGHDRPPPHLPVEHGTSPANLFSIPIARPLSVFNPMGFDHSMSWMSASPRASCDATPDPCDEFHVVTPCRFPFPAAHQSIRPKAGASSLYPGLEFDPFHIPAGQRLGGLTSGPAGGIWPHPDWTIYYSSLHVPILGFSFAFDDFFDYEHLTNRRPRHQDSF
jgi:hypothetical protein